MNEVQCINHVIDCNLSMNTYRQHGNDTTLQTVIEYKGRSTSLFHVKRNRLKSAHVEEGLVLNSGKTWMVQELAIHEVALLVKVIRFTFIKVLISNVILIFDYLDGIFSALRVQTTLHENVKEKTYCGVIRQRTVDIDCPEEWMGFRVRRIRERYQINSDMPYETFFIQNVSYCLAYSHEIHGR